ncbi:MAG TPA: complex I NDUFA9 subunit family protein [Alphaproteobacteria bacterium]|nr:complex I NDUFA9 subunit family protein [Alphaproteobacteria bacterium]
MAAFGKRITVFGGSGFIGRYLIRRLAIDGWVVRVAVRDPVAAAFLKTCGSLGQIVPMRCDIRADALVAAAVQGADAVVNLVGILAESGRQRFDAIHAQAAGRIARAAKQAGAATFVHVSALGADPNSDALYARSKAAGEAAVRSEFPAATVIRPSIVIGPEDEFFNRFAWLAQILPALPLIGGGRTRFQPVYVGDVAEAIHRSVNDPATAGKTYELGGPRVYSFRELMQLMLQVIGRRRLLVPVPFALAELQGLVLQLLPNAPLTRDQVKMLRHDSIVGTGAAGFADLGLQPQAIEAILPTYLEIYRPGGRFAANRVA